MPVTVEQIVLWRAEVENKPGTLALTLEPPAKAGADLKVIMGYRPHAGEGKAVIEVFPITGGKLTAAAETAGLTAAHIPALLVEGDNKPGLGYTVAQTIGAGGINMAFFVAQVIGRKFAAVIGFETEDDARKAAPLIQKATKQGWSYIKGRLRCPACEAKRKADAAVKKQENDEMTEAATVTELRQPTREQKRQIMSMLEASYDTKAGRYTGGDTDKTVAETIGGGIMPGWVSEIREEFFGPDGSNDDMEAVIAEMKSALEAFTVLRKENDEVAERAQRIENDMNQHKARIDRAISRIETIKAAVGPKVARA